MNKLPAVVIVGRQNVGKSTLFNALVKKRIAIVSPTPGVTRDYIEQELTIENRKFNLIDTGGITQEKHKKELEYLISLNTIDIIAKADIILFVVEKDELTPMDQKIADIIRKKNKRCIVVVNKVDVYKYIQMRELFAQYYSLGFNTIVPISATHRINFSELFEKIFELLPNEISPEKDKEDIIEIAVVGKPNVGKSSVLNKILKIERSLVTEIPGTTRDSIDTKIIFAGKKLNLIDTAGMRRKSRVDQDIEYYSINRSIKSIKRADVVLVVLSADEGITLQDKKIFYLIEKYKKSALLLLNKWDLVLDYDINAYKNTIKTKFPLIAHISVLPVSAKTGYNIEKILNQALTVYTNYSRRLSTQEFNKFIQNIINRYSPPQQGGVIKIYYGTQFKIKPPSFLVWTNRPKSIKDNYKRFLVNKLRENYKFDGSPILLKFRKK